MARKLPDLRNMTAPVTQQLLDFLRAIEAGETSWPDQWLVGCVIRLLKPDRAPDGVNSYSRIVILSIIYRTWAAVRARQILHGLKDTLQVL